MKRKLIIAALVALIGTSVSAQQLPLYSQLYFMRMLYNPALTAYNGSSNLYGFYREQWTGLPGHPVTRGAMGEISLWKDKSGIGFHVYNDNTDIIHSVNAQAYYAQKIHLAKSHTLSLGVSLGIMNTYIDFAGVRASDPNDPNLLKNGTSGTGFDMNIGLAYQWKKLTIGFAIPHVALSKVSMVADVKSARYTSQRHFVGSISYDFGINHEKFNIEPSVLIKSGSNLPIQVDANVVANYKKVVYLGVGYRLDYGMTGMAAVRIARCVTIGYAYEYPIMNNVSYGNTNGTHEVLLGLNFDRWLRNNKKVEELEKQVEVLNVNRAQDSAKIEAIKAQNEQINKDLDEAKKNLSEFEKSQQAKVTELQTRIDSFESEVKEYNKSIKSKPVTVFSDNKTGTLTPGDIYKMDQVLFQTNSSYMKPESFAQLDILSKMMLENPNMKVRVLGHTDYTASDEYNQWLSDRRAKRVADYLITKGVSETNLSYKGFGKKAPVADNSTEEGRAKNRRVEIQILK
jgi:type IX secretion system PorP/SprF family membrane protein